MFDAARDIAVHVESATGTGERAVAGMTTGLMNAGDIVTWEARHLGLRRRLTVRISRFDRPREFEDVMVDGPFRSMRHVHRFVATDGGTRMVDDFEYTAPFGLLGSAVSRVYLTGYLRRFLVSRAAVLRSVAESRARASS